jgi:response regulator RpfG family c-di-GMP phosphodiesterase
MSLAEGTGANSSPEPVALGEVLTLFGRVCDHAAGVPPDEGDRVASLAMTMASLAGLTQEDSSALYFAARLRNAGVLGNRAFAKGDALADRDSMMERWKVPAHGARLCERILALPPGTADIVRWQAECWDGTGYPDQLRWTGIPKAAQLLHIAQSFAGAVDAEEALSAITFESGRSFAPEQTHTFVIWFHTYGGEIGSIEPPYEALRSGVVAKEDVLTLLSERLDDHNGVPGRAERIASHAQQIGAALQFSAQELEQMLVAARLFAIGELRVEGIDSSQFDPLARLGVQSRAAEAAIAAELLQAYPATAAAASIVRARAEWYDGTGAPKGLRQSEIPRTAQALALATAFEAIDRTYHTRIGANRTLPIVRIETAAGTQFDPLVVRALTEIVRART